MAKCKQSSSHIYNWKLGLSVMMNSTSLLKDTPLRNER